MKKELKRQATNLIHQKEAPRHHFNGFDFLPKEVIVEILARVAANSMHDLFNMKMSCKIFKKLGEDNYIYRTIPLINILRMMGPHPKEGNAFLQRCIKCDNAEVLYDRGLHEYLRTVNVEQGMELLKKAVQIGHLGASYVVGLLLLLEGGESRKEGVRLLRKVYATGRIVEYRNEFLNVILWNKAMILKEDPPRYDCGLQSKHCKRNPWLRDINDYNGIECEQCICRAEIDIMYKYGIWG